MAHRMCLPHLLTTKRLCVALDKLTAYAGVACSDNDQQIPTEFRRQIEDILKTKPKSGGKFYEGQVLPTSHAA